MSLAHSIPPPRATPTSEDFKVPDEEYTPSLPDPEPGGDPEPEGTTSLPSSSARVNDYGESEEPDSSNWLMPRSRMSNAVVATMRLSMTSNGWICFASKPKMRSPPTMTSFWSPTLSGVLRW